MKSLRMASFNPERSTISMNSHELFPLMIRLEYTEMKFFVQIRKVSEQPLSHGRASTISSASSLAMAHPYAVSSCCS